MGRVRLGFLTPLFGLCLPVIQPVSLNHFHYDSVQHPERRYVSIWLGLNHRGWFLFGGAPSFSLQHWVFSSKAMGSSNFTGR